MLADEPSGNLDTQSADAVFDLLRAVNEQRGNDLPHRHARSAACRSLRPDHRARRWKHRLGPAQHERGIARAAPRGREAQARRRRENSRSIAERSALASSGATMQVGGAGATGPMRGGGKALWTAGAGSPPEAWLLGVVLPPRREELHGHGIVARAACHPLDRGLAAVLGAWTNKTR